MTEFEIKFSKKDNEMINNVAHLLVEQWYGNHLAYEDSFLELNKALANRSVFVPKMVKEVETFLKESSEIEEFIDECYDELVDDEDDDDEDDDEDDDDEDDNSKHGNKTPPSCIGEDMNSNIWRA